MIESSFRFSRFDPAWRVDGVFSNDLWMDVTDTERPDVSFVDDYLPVEDRYVRAVVGIFEAAEVRRVFLADVETSRSAVAELRQGGWLVDLPDPLPQSVVDVEPVVRAGLRCQLWCRLWSSPVEVAFGHDLYMAVASRSAGLALREVVEREGLFVKASSYDFVNPGDYTFRFATTDAGRADGRGGCGGWGGGGGCFGLVTRIGFGW